MLVYDWSTAGSVPPGFVIPNYGDWREESTVDPDDARLAAEYQAACSAIKRKPEVIISECERKFGRELTYLKNDLDVVCKFCGCRFGRHTGPSERPICPAVC